MSTIIYVCIVNVANIRQCNGVASEKLDETIAVRVDATTLARVDAYACAQAPACARVGAPVPTRSTVLRHALLLGLDALERLGKLGAA